MHWTTCMNSRGLAVRCWETCKTIWLRTEVRGRSDLRADWVKMACSRFSNIKHKRLCFTTSPNTVIKIACVAAVSFPLPGEEIKQAASKRVENSTRSWEFLHGELRGGWKCGQIYLECFRLSLYNVHILSSHFGDLFLFLHPNNGHLSMISSYLCPKGGHFREA